MDIGIYTYSHRDSLLIDKIVNEFLSQGKFDKLRKECMSDADTKPAYQNLQQRVETTVSQFLRKQVWRPDLNKNQLRDSLRKHILESGFFDAGINRIVDQVVNPNVLATIFMPEVEEVVYNFLSIPRPMEKHQKRGISLNSEEKDKCSINESDGSSVEQKEKLENDVGKRKEKTGQAMEMVEEEKPKVSFAKVSSTENDNESLEGELKSGSFDYKLKQEPREEAIEDVNCKEENQNQMIAEDSDNSNPLEINEKSMSEGRDSEDSIMNQMSPISQGRLTPDLEEGEKEKVEPIVVEDEKCSIEAKETKVEERKRPLTFIGRIPKLKREDSESSRSSKTEILRKDKVDMRNVYSSDESDSSKSYGKSDSDERKKREQKEEKRGREDKGDGKTKKKHEFKSSKKRSDGKSKDRRDESRDKNRDGRSSSSSKKSSSSSASSSMRERSSGSQKSIHLDKRNDFKARDGDRKKEEEKKKSKSADDHGKERKWKEDRRSTDRDSKEREKGSGSRNLGEKKRREKEEGGGEGEREREGKERTRKGKSETERETDYVPDSREEIEVSDEEKAELEIALEKEEKEATGGMFAVDFDELLKIGALSRVEFPKLTDDFYVKFDSTGFRYFEEWEQKKMDCEDEFKEFVDEAEDNLNLISDDDSESETGSIFDFEKENQKIIKSLLSGLGNFCESVMFDPHSSMFYKWTSKKSFDKFRNKREGRKEAKFEEKEESDGSDGREGSGVRSSDGEKENRVRENTELHLKLLNKYRRKAMRKGKHRRSQKKAKDLSRGIKEKDENRSASGFLLASYRSESEFLFKTAIPESGTWRPPNQTKTECQISVDSRGVANGGNKERDVDGLLMGGEVVGRASATVVGVLPDSPEGNDNSSSWDDAQDSKAKRKGLESEDNFGKCPTLSQKCDLPHNLPPSPDSDDVHANNEIRLSDTGKRVCPPDSEGARTPRKQIRRNYGQKYESHDLYKPRPVLNTNRTRSRERGLASDVDSLDAAITRSKVARVEK